MQQLRTGFFHQLWNGEIPVLITPSRKLRVAGALLTLFLATGIVGSLLMALHNDALFLGPGLGLTASTEPFEEFRHWLDSRVPGLGVALLVLAACSAVSIFLLTIHGYFGYHKRFAQDYPLREHFTFPLIALLERVFYSLAIVLFGVIAWLAGFDFASGYGLVVHWATATNEWVMLNIPTLIELPYILAFFVSYGIAGFIHYWMHRISHERRFFWLLFHRFHHFPTVMFPASTPPVFFAVPLFIFVVIPYHLAFAGLTKLFCDQPLYFALIIYKLLFYIPDCWAHNTVTYDSGRRNPLVRWASLFFSNGIYHYIHHASEKIDGKPTNTINLGGSFLYLPDKLFGTFRELPEKAPAIGLTDNPPLYYNPLRLALSGMAQLVFELRHNPVREWGVILFGRVGEDPPATCDYALKRG